MHDVKWIKQHRVGDKIFNISLYIFFALCAFVCFYPFYYLFINSISANDVSARGGVFLHPIGVHFTNYISMFMLEGLGNATFITLSRTVLGTLATLLGSTVLGFAFTQQKMWGRVFWYRWVIATMYFSAGLIPVYITYLHLGLINNFWVYILPAVIAPFNVILVKTYIESTPASLQEAAEIDGAGFLRIYATIILPISKPIIATVAIFAAVGQWNAFTDTLIFITDERLFPLQFMLYRFLTQSASLAQLIRASGGAPGIDMSILQYMQTPTSVRMTISVIVFTPVLFVYPFFQRFFVKGIMIGSVKG
ncbi:MAG: carbohydrate ABC transporter permease [Defluviitaleaceae bacterium]|nr:carbohydrate ABC transporter permease [Defluviitaleaceae bacterium]